MLKKNKKILSVITATLVMLIGISFTNAQAASIKRMNGSNRIDTANKTAKEIFQKSEAVILVNGTGYADAVSSAPLSKLLNAPILLTENKGALESDVLKTINDLQNVKKIYIVGGTGVVSTTMENSLKSKGFQVIRYDGQKYGDKTRYGTNARVAEEILKLSPKSKTGILVNGQDGYADALSVASVAATNGYPVLFGNTQNVPNVIKNNIILKNKLQILAVGGSGVLPSSVVSSVSGKKITSDAQSKNRFQTNLAVLEYFKGKGGLDFSNVYIAAGGQAGKAGQSQFADALVASAAAAKTGSPLVLSGLGAGTTEIANAEKFIETNIEDEGNLVIVGGKASVSESVEQKLDEKVGDFRILDIL
ncbi:cell wall binding repeat 2 family protein [Clostridium botulinum]|uniref:cell wall-binding repeat-containing protein n=1 Tax=Clostridium botulinum TaxID=1491 RepID=UPI0009473FAC|nr:cell wall-binding repeat-containing protein [Clostridium botulinum]APR00911.1 cell wall binding repeat 2 family protein [Clostridium botulinum]OSA74936.1 cell wall-binding repeat 2 family protein [Clostridium botulinum]